MRQLTVNPFVSEAQRAWMFANEPDMAKRWAKHTSKNKILPRRKHPVTNGRVARLDPSRTITLRRQFQADLARRFAKLRQAIVQLILHDDALGLKPRPALVFHAEDEPGNWITVRGQHIFIPEGRDKGEAVKKHFEELGKKKEEKLPDLHKDDIAKLRVEDLLLDKRAVQHTRGDLDNGRKSHTEGPLDVWKTEDGRYLVVDGYHRVLEGIDRGTKEFNVRVVGEGHTDYWVIPDKDNIYHPPVIKEDAFGLRRRRRSVFNATNDEGEEGRWITVKGNPVFIPDGVDKGDAIKKHFEEKKSGGKKADQPNEKHFGGLKSKKIGSLLMPSSTPGQKKTAAAISELMIRQTEGHVQGQEVHKRVAAESPYYVLTKVPIDSLSRYDDADVHPEQARSYKGPIIVSSSGEILDGRHRTAAAKLRGETEIDAWVPIKPPTRNVAINTRWKFHSTEQKLTAFREWIKRQIQLHLIGEHLDETAWWNRYIMDGFRRGAARAFDDTRPQVREWQDSPEARQRLSWYNGTREEFLRSSFNWPASREKVKLLASRAFTDLKGVTDSMAARISHTLVDGLTKGDNPRVIARELAKNVNLGKVRAQTIARTEIIRTHAEGQLDAFKKMGVTEVGVMAEWATAEDSRVCKLCQPLDGVVLKVEEATGLLPRHPNCRCCWLPANVGEDESDQKRGKGSIGRAFDESYKAELSSKGDRSLEEQKERSSWGAADKTIAKTRPKSILSNAEEEGRWVTIRGAHVLIKDGVIVKGPKDLVGKPPKSPPSIRSNPDIQLGYKGADGSFENVPTKEQSAKYTKIRNTAISAINKFGIDTSGLDALQLVTTEDDSKSGAYAFGKGLAYRISPNSESQFTSVFRETKFSWKEGTVPLFAFASHDDVMIHEIAHNIARKMPQEDRTKWEDVYKQNSDKVENLPSFYAQENSSEMWAESVTAIIKGYPFGGTAQHYVRKSTVVEDFVRGYLNKIKGK